MSGTMQSALNDPAVAEIAIRALLAIAYRTPQEEARLIAWQRHLAQITRTGGTQ